MFCVAPPGAIPGGVAAVITAELGARDRHVAIGLDNHWIRVLCAPSLSTEANEPSIGARR